MQENCFEGSGLLQRAALFRLVDHVVSPVLAIERQVVRQEFDGDKTIEACIFRLVHYAHAPATQFLDNSVMRDGPAYERISARHSAVILGCDLRQVNESTVLVGAK